MILSSKRVCGLHIGCILLALAGCGEETLGSQNGPVEVDFNDGNLVEVKDENFLMRTHIRAPVLFEESISYTARGTVESWNVGSPFGELLFGDYDLTIRDRSDDGKMDSLALSIDGPSQRQAFIQFFDNNLDQHPDVMSYSVIVHKGQVNILVDLNMDGIFDFKDGGDEGMNILLDGNWIEVETVSDFYKEDSPEATSNNSKVSYAFLGAAWEITGSGNGQSQGHDTRAPD